MKTPTAFRYICDACEKECTQSHLTVMDQTPGAVMMHLFGGSNELHFCSTDCLVGTIAEKVNA